MIQTRSKVRINSQMHNEYMLTIADGKFGAMMDVSLTNEVRNSFWQKSDSIAHHFSKGPVTFTLDSRKFEYVDTAVQGSGGRKEPKQAKVPPVVQADAIPTPQ